MLRYCIHIIIYIIIDTERDVELTTLKWHGSLKQELQLFYSGMETKSRECKNLNLFGNNYIVNNTYEY